MRWSELYSEAFNKPGSRTIRLGLSLLFITLATVVVMALFQMAKQFFDPGMTIWESRVYTILFTGVLAPLVALFVLLKFDGLYRKVSRENVERKRVEAELRESEAMFKQIIDASPIPMVVYHEEKNFYINKKFTEVFGYTAEDIPSINEWWPLAYPDENYRALVKQKWYEAVGAAVANKTSITPQEVTITCKDGSKKYIINYFSSIGHMNLSILQDVTRRKQAEEEAKKSDMRFRSLIQNSSDIIRILDNEGRIVFDSPSSEKILGYPPGYTLGKLTYDFIHPDDIKLVQQELGSVHEKQNTGTPTEFRIRKADGEYLWVESIGVNMAGVPGVEGIVITTRPIGERKKGQEELKAAKQQAELYLDLMGHDINNIHQAALGYIELARDMPGDRGKEYLDKASEALQRSTLLINNVRKLQKSRENRVQAYDMDVCKVLAGVHEEYATVPGKTVTLSLNGHKQCRVRADDLLHDVFSNLVGNAVKHTGDHTQVSIDLDTVRENGKDYCRVRVDDNGPGIPDEFKKMLFTRSLKGTSRAKGMGLGLYIVKTLVENYEGRVWAEDRVPGDHTKGARFVVMLPVIQQ